MSGEAINRALALAAVSILLKSLDFQDRVSCFYTNRDILNNILNNMVFAIASDRMTSGAGFVLVA